MKNTSIICRDIKNKQYKVKTEELNFRPSVYALIFQGTKILLCRQWDGYDFPGGGIKKGETIEAALKREVWEETGLKVTPDKVIKATQDFFISIESKKRLHSILIYYICKNPKGKISTKNFDENEKVYLKPAEWVDIKEVKKIKFYNGVDSPKLIKEALALNKK